MIVVVVPILVFGRRSSIQAVRSKGSGPKIPGTKFWVRSPGHQAVFQYQQNLAQQTQIAIFQKLENDGASFAITRWQDKPELRICRRGPVQGPPAEGPRGGRAARRGAPWGKGRPPRGPVRGAARRGAWGGGYTGVGTPQKTLQSPNRQYKAPTDFTRT